MRGFLWKGVSTEYAGVVGNGERKEVSYGTSSFFAMSLVSYSLSDLMELPIGVPASFSPLVVRW